MASYIVINKDKLKEICLSTQEMINKDNIKRRQEYIDRNLNRLKNYGWFEKFIDKIFNCSIPKTKEQLENYWDNHIWLYPKKEKLINSMILACDNACYDNVNISVKDLYEVSKL
jgi:hypothetical protein